MKTLQKTFIKNADKCGNHTFTQLRREGDVCLYRRNRMDGSIHSFELFVTKIIKAGTPLPGGGKVEEDYEPYPGASAFGRTAWSFGAMSNDQALNRRFDELVKSKSDLPIVEDEDEDTDETIPVARVVKGEVKLKIPDGEFSQRELASFNGFDNYKIVYTDLQKMLSSGVLIRGSVRPAPRGKPAQLFRKA